MPLLSEFIGVKRRYSRSINLERDIEIPDSINGYVPTPRSLDAIQRFLRALSNPNSVRAWTVTGAYGTGKSSFAHFLTALCSPKDDLNRIKARKILKDVVSAPALIHSVQNDVPDSGLLRAVVTAQREPFPNTVIRALDRGATMYWRTKRGPKPRVLAELNELKSEVLRYKRIEDRKVIQVTRSLAEATKAGILLVIDELGKSLEFCAQEQSIEDLYLLQQIAELPSGERDPKVIIFGLLHQSFSEYANSLTTVQRNEWAKVQGRFEDIPFVESSERVMNLVGRAIEKSQCPFFSELGKWASSWKKALSGYDFSKNLSPDDISAVYPLHPITAIVLPILCLKFSQNDRTLFTFLASNEPDSFHSFLQEADCDGRDLPTFKLYRLYDYFVEAATMSISLRPQLQRWVEIQGRMADAKHLDNDTLLVLKAVGILNLISTTGSLRATPELVSLAMSDSPYDKNQMERVTSRINLLVEKGFLTWRKQLDEIRIWDGSDFDIEREISEQSQILNVSVAALLNEHFPLRPLVAQRHSYQKGTLRYFERQYFDDVNALMKVSCKKSNSDGLICYWLGDERQLNTFPTNTIDGKPLIGVLGISLKALQLACYELSALKVIENNAAQLQTDGVARREVRQRIILASRVLDEALARSFDVASSDVTCLIEGRREKFNSSTNFNARVSEICDSVYSKSPLIWNELINRRELTSQGSTARRKLVEAMIQCEGSPRLGLVGNGPEVSMYESLLRSTGIHRRDGEDWSFCPPPKESGIYSIWEAIESFCFFASKSPADLGQLYGILETPPYGIKQGAIPLLLLAVLLCHSDQISIYQDGTFIPSLGPEHFELLVKKPERFSVKYFEISGLRVQIFRELQKIMSPASVGDRKQTRNATVITIVKPLIRFVTKLPQYTLHTSHVSAEAKAVRKALLEAKEPDLLLFDALPRALGILFTTDSSNNESIGKIFRAKLVKVLKELQANYENRLERCRDLLHKAFSVRSERSRLREDLRVRATYLQGQVIEPQLKSFVIAAADETQDEKAWLESVIMTVAIKPVSSWTDEEVRIFEIKLSDVARRFCNVEAIQKIASRPRSEGFEARRLTITYPNGREINRMIWVDRAEKDKIDRLAQQILKDETINEDSMLKQYLVATLVEKVLAEKVEHEDVALINVREKHSEVG